MINNNTVVAYFNDDYIKGTIRFYEIDNNKIIVDVNLCGFEKNSIHKIYIQMDNKVEDKYVEICENFKPFQQTCKGINYIIKYVGDLGIIQSDNNGNIKIQIEDKIIKLKGNKFNIINKRIFIDDYNEEILKTSNYNNSNKILSFSDIFYPSKIFKKLNIFTKN